MIPFSLQAAVGCVGHATLALALAAEFHEADLGEADAVLDDLAAPVAAARVRAHDPLAALEVLRSEVAVHLDVHQSLLEIDDLLLDEVVIRRRGHPLALTVLCAEVGRRAGLPLDIACGAGGAFVIHAGPAPLSLVLDVRDPRVLRPAARLGGELRRQCAHQVSERLLCGIAGRAHRAGHVPHALLAAELRLALPVGAKRRQSLEDDLKRVRARLN
jgi:hypothetical protein